MCGGGGCPSLGAAVCGGGRFKVTGKWEARQSAAYVYRMYLYLMFYLKLVSFILFYSFFKAV